MQELKLDSSLVLGSSQACHELPSHATTFDDNVMKDPISPILSCRGYVVLMTPLMTCMMRE